MQIILSAKERVKIKIRLSFCRAHYEEVVLREKILFGLYRLLCKERYCGFRCVKQPTCKRERLVRYTQNA